MVHTFMDSILISYCGLRHGLSCARVSTMVPPSYTLSRRLFAARGRGGVRERGVFAAQPWTLRTCPAELMVLLHMNSTVYVWKRSGGCIGWLAAIFNGGCGQEQREERLV